jgi:CheY-like chemotaxis protein
MTDGFRCPYCARPLHWIPNRWLGGSGSFECLACGDFPDFRRKPTDADAELSPDAIALSAAATKRPPRVLVVDDSREQCELYAFMLERAAEVLMATDGARGLEIAHTTPPDVMLLDVIMPGMSGWDVCDQLRADPVTAGIPVVILTGFDGVDVPARAKRAGAKAVLMKPCPVDRLLLTIDGVTGLGAQSSKLKAQGAQNSCLWQS